MFFKRIIGALQIAWGRTPLFIVVKKPEENIDWIRKAVAKQGVCLWHSGKLKVLRELMRPVMWLMWPFRAVIISFNKTKQHGIEVEALTGKSVFQQQKELLVLSLRDQVSPDLYYLYRLYQDDVYDQAKYYISGFAISTLQAFLNDFAVNDVLHNKLECENKLRENNINVIDSIALLRSGKIDFFKPELSKNQLPAIDLLVKPNKGKCGIDIKCFQNKEGKYIDLDGKIYDSKQLKNLLLQISVEQEILVQPVVKNHPLIADLGNGALSTVRIITGLTIDNQIEVVMASFKMACGTNVVDNFSSNGIATSVELNTGRLSSGIQMKVLSPVYDIHPDSGGKITGRKLPCWNDAKKTVVNAHALFCQFIFLAWDVAITPEGPKILEANDNWGAEILQIPARFPLGQHRFAEISVEWIKKKHSKVTSV